MQEQQFFHRWAQIQLRKIPEMRYKNHYLFAKTLAIVASNQINHDNSTKIRDVSIKAVE